jgi:CHAT domain-containing protein
VYQVAQTLAKAWSGQTIWLITGDSAQQVALEESMPGRRVLHFGTHGFFAPASQCEGLASYEAGSGGLLGSVVERGGVDPMKLSALVLSGASVTGARQSSADGALTARELVSLDLSAVELATLAACETGRGEVIAGEGAQGLGKAFLVAGAREVIVSLWQVPDRETAVLMDSLYRALPRRYEAGQAQRALSASQRALRGRLKASQPHHVFSWAAFITLVSAPAFGASGR